MHKVVMLQPPFDLFSKQRDDLEKINWRTFLANSVFPVSFINWLHRKKMCWANNKLNSYITNLYNSIWLLALFPWEKWVLSFAGDVEEKKQCILTFWSRSAQVTVQRLKTTFRNLTFIIGSGRNNKKTSQSDSRDKS
jgi:hypothetical protein